MVAADAWVVTSVLLVDDHPKVRAGLHALLSGREDIDVVGTAANGREAVELAARLRPDVVLMDLSMPVLDGVTATRRIRDQLPSTQVVVLSSFADDRGVAEAVAAGATGYLLKDCDPRDLVLAVRSVAHGSAPFDPRVAPGPVRGLLRSVGSRARSAARRRPPYGQPHGGD